MEKRRALSLSLVDSKHLEVRVKGGAAKKIKEAWPLR